MKVVALVSGGKDSCYSTLLCQRHGHEVVALANLLPRQPAVDDLDSYMYQTVGHQVLGAYAACTGLPLFRRRITGTSADQRLVYEDTCGDEVEDLAALLAYVKAQHPEVEAVASGAIASDYQRTRVERVCARLGLVSLGYLWRRPQAALLRGMVDVGIDAILVKIAAAGLTPDRHLGAHLAALPAQLHRLRRLYGSNVCGEGGEYETLTLDCPLFRYGRVVLDSWEAVIVSGDALAPVALLHPTAFHVEPKPVAGAAPGQAEVVEVPEDYAAEPAPVLQPPEVPPAVAAATAARISAPSGSQLACVCAEVAADAPLDAGTASGTQLALAAALAAAASAVGVEGLSFRDALFVHLYVPSMAHFAAANVAYAAFFPAINPPARATVQLAASGGLALAVEVWLVRPPASKRVLHVQSISSWAPSCIGPYSQAVEQGGLLYFAGQIPLDPASMGVLQGGLDLQCVRSLLSCQAVAVAMQTDLRRSMLWCTAYCSKAAGAAGATAVLRHLQAFQDARLDADLVAACSAGADSRQRGSSNDENDEGDDDAVLDGYLLPPSMRRRVAPLVCCIEVPALPRGVDVELQPVGHLPTDDSPSPSSSSSSDSDGEGAETSQKHRHWLERLHRLEESGPAASGTRLATSALVSEGRLLKALVSVEAPEGLAVTGEAVRAALGSAGAQLRALLSRTQLAGRDVVCCKLCWPGRVADMSGNQAREALGLGSDLAVALVPVSAVRSSEAAAPAAALLDVLCLRGSE